MVGSLIKRVTRAIWALKSPPPDGSEHYRSGWDDGLEAAMDAARDALAAVLPAPFEAALPSETGPKADSKAALAEDLRYVLNYTGHAHAHERPGVWDTSGKPCTHCARLAVARQNLAAYDANPAAVLPAPDQQTALVAERDSLGRETDRLRKDWVEMRDRAERAEAELRRLAGEAQQDERCTRCTHPKGDHDGRADHRARHSPLVAGEPWCHACTAECDYTRVAQQDSTQDGEARPQRGDQFEQWLKAQRDATADYPEAHQAADGLLDLYRLHADTGTPLTEHVCEGRVVGDCECLEQPAAVARSGQPDTDDDDAVCRCGHKRKDHDAKYADPQCRLCPEDGEKMWRHEFVRDTPPSV